MVSWYYKPNGGTVTGNWRSWMGEISKACTDIKLTMPTDKNNINYILCSKIDIKLHQYNREITQE
jgi:hypothetical protein